MTATTCGDILLLVFKNGNMGEQEMTDLMREFVKLSAEVISMVDEGQAGAHNGGENIGRQANAD